MVLYDGHVHTPFCPHGTGDTLQQYVERAIDMGMDGITFTEHAPLPKGFIDPTPDKDSGMKYEDLNQYFSTLQKLKDQYKHRLTIKIGLEVDFILGWEKETEQFLNEFGPMLDDSILSVHFLEVDKGYVCMDYSPEVFGELVNRLGDINTVYNAYFNTLQSSVKAELGLYKPKRIGHMTLAKKFQLEYPPSKSFNSKAESILDIIAQKGYQLDYNGAGVVKSLCGEPYPDQWIIKEAIKREIPLVYGSDAHSVKGLGQGFDQLYSKDTLTTPL
jgi:histidinol-phosphatase (PHP family)